MKDSQNFPGYLTTARARCDRTQHELTLDWIFIRKQRPLDDVIGGHNGFTHRAVGSSSTSEAQSVMDFFCMAF